MPKLHITSRLKLRHKFTLAILVNIGIILLCFVAMIHTFQEQELVDNVEQRNLSLVRNMASEAADGLLMRNLQHLDSLVRSAQESIDAAYVLVLDATDRIVAHTDRNRLGEQRAEPGKQELQVRTVGTGAAPLKEYSVPVSIRGEHLGWCILGVNKHKDEARVASGLRELRTKLIVVSGGLFILAFGSSLFLASLLTKRMRLLRDKMRQVQLGDFTVSVPEGKMPVCSEYLNCGHTQCPAHGQTKCWTIANRFLEQYKSCLDCAVYTKSAGDEIGELNLAFNQMVQDLRHNIRKLEQANLEKSRMERLSLLGQMSAQVAHEIKNPLNSIIGAAHYLRANFQGQILREFLQIIEEESQRLSDIVTNFLNFSKPAQPSLVRNDLNEVVKNTLSLVEQEVEDRGVALHCEPDRNLRPFKFDAAKVKQALLNILINASQATQSGDRITVRTSQDNGWISLEVADTGCGMDEEALDNLFKPFFTTKVRGSGLGLAIAEQNVRDLGGSIQVESPQGEGSRFTVWLPAQ
ncbi:ATP-binding protein [Desulfovermiculus halophilus]|jgi:signal transduction histidine kinase|uniref:ATP-binding protein n=1 Tax=Desulfovermiculus halophilus TaxID=339722 RepID=UPI000688BA47|nr:ATP-binding protein [Desulfovermiculus halophilus]